MSRKARIAVIGAGWWSTTAHLPAIIAHPDAELTALVDADPERLARAASAFGNPNTYTSLEALLLTETVDAAVIATPHATHFALAQQCLDAGLHVLIEKPMTLYASEARALQTSASGWEVIVGYPWNYTEQAKTAREWVASGRLGAIQYVTAIFSSYHLDLLSGATREATVHGPTTAYADPKLSGGGHGHLQITHIAGLLFFITDLQIARVQAQMTGFGLPLDVADAGLVTFDNGALGVMSGTSTAKRSRALLRLDGEKGSLELDPLAGTLSFFGDETETLGPPEEIARTYPYKAPVENLIGVALGRETNQCPAEVGCRAVELLDALYRSAQSDGAAITLEDLQ